MSHARKRRTASGRAALAFLIATMGVALSVMGAQGQDEPHSDKQALEAENGSGRVASPGLIRVPPPLGRSTRGAFGAGQDPANIPPSSSGWWYGSAGVVAVLAICGAVCAGARNRWSLGTTAAMRIVGRMSLSPRHSIVLVQAGERTLMIGLGPQSAPTLLGELPPGDAAETPPATGSLQRPLRGVPVARQQRWPAVDIQLGDEE